MIRKLIWIVLLFLCISIESVFAQKISVIPELNNTKFSYIPDSLFQIDWKNTFPETDYIILHKQTHVEITDDGRSITANLHHHIRVKILTENGVKASVIGLPYLQYLDMEKIVNIEAFAYNNRELHRLDTSLVKTIDVNDKVSFKEFQIPNAKVGSVLEYRYTTQRRYIEELPEFYFQQEVPVLFAGFSLTEAPYLKYDSTVLHEVVPVAFQKKMVDTTSTIKIFTKKYADPITTLIWTASTIPAFSAEPFVLKANEYRMHLKLNWSHFGIPLQVIESNWDLVSAELSKNSGFETNIQKAKKWRKWGKEARESFNISDAKTLADSIFHFVQKKAKFNGHKTILSETTPDSLWDEPVQSAAVINQALISALRGAGFKAYPVLATTIHHTEISQVYPTKYLFEYILTGLELAQDEIRLFDPSDAFAHPNMIPADYVNQKGLLLRGIKDYKWIDLLNDVSVFDQQIWIKGELTQEGTLHATVKGDASGYIARDMREKMAKNEDLRDHFKALLFDRYWKTSLEPVHINSDPGDVVQFEFDFTLDNAGSVIEKGMAFKPLVVGYLNQNPFEKNNRNLPIQFKAEEHLVLNTFIKVPKGFSSKFGTAELKYGFDGAFIQWKQYAGRDIDFRFEVRLNRLDYDPSSYSFIKKLYDTWKEMSDKEWVIEKL